MKKSILTAIILLTLLVVLNGCTQPPVQPTGKGMLKLYITDSSDNQNYFEGTGLIIEGKEPNFFYFCPDDSNNCYYIEDRTDIFPFYAKREIKVKITGELSEIDTTNMSDCKLHFRPCGKYTYLEHTSIDPVTVEKSGATDIQSIKITISRIEVHSPNANSWFTVFEGEEIFDLMRLNLEAGIRELIEKKELEAGKYTQIRLDINKAEIDVLEKQLVCARPPPIPPECYQNVSNTYQVKISSSEIKLNRPFTIDENGTTELILDFKPESVKQTGKGEYILKPVINVLTKEEFEEKILKFVPFDKLIENAEDYAGKEICTQGYYRSAFELSGLGKEIDYSGPYLKGEVIWVEGGLDRNELNCSELEGKQFTCYGKVKACGKFENGKGMYGHLGRYKFQLSNVTFKVMKTEEEKYCEKDEDCTAKGCCPCTGDEAVNKKFAPVCDYNKMPPCLPCAPPITYKCISNECTTISTKKELCEATGGSMNTKIVKKSSARGDKVEPPSIEEDCQLKLQYYLKYDSDFLNNKFVSCTIKESSVGWGEKECPNDFSPQGCANCTYECLKDFNCNCPKGKVWDEKKGCITI